MAAGAWAALARTRLATTLTRTRFQPELPLAPDRECRTQSRASVQAQFYTVQADEEAELIEGGAIFTGSSGAVQPARKHQLARLRSFHAAPHQMNVRRSVGLNLYNESAEKSAGFNSSCFLRSPRCDNSKNQAYSAI